MNKYDKKLKRWAERREAIIVRASKGETGAAIARSLGVTRSAICKILKKGSFPK
jgi:transcriptional regulator with XRE-family HTH domain